MKASKDSRRRWSKSRILISLLAVSLLVNLAFVLKPYVSRVAENMREAMATPPTVNPSDQIRGNPNAKVTVIVYTDYECPYCARLHATLLTLLKEGADIRVIYRNFPLISHQFSEQAAEAAECAGAQGKFWQYGDALFASINKVHNDSYFMHIASGLELNGSLFSACLSSGKFHSVVTAQIADGASRRLMAVPTLFVNGKRFNGAISLDQFKAYLATAGT